MEKTLSLEARLSQLVDILMSYGPEVADVTLAATRISAISSLIAGFAMLAAVAIFVRLLTRHISREREKAGDTFDMIDCNPLILFFSILGIMLFGLTAPLLLLDLWNWVGVFEPKLYLAHKFLGV